MKVIFLLTALLVLNSCNTSIGLYRDAAQGFNWTRAKIQGTGGGGADSPVY